MQDLKLDWLRGHDNGGVDRDRRAPQKIANRVNSLSFSVKDDTKPRSEAITIATRDAHAQASALASALGVKLGKVVKATTVSEVRPIPMQRGGMAMAMSAKVATPVEPGEVTVPATVSLTFEIE